MNPSICQIQHRLTSAYIQNSKNRSADIFLLLIEEIQAEPKNVLQTIPEIAHNMVFRNLSQSNQIELL